MLRYLIYSLRIRRVEYRVAEIPIFLIPTLLTNTYASGLPGTPFWEGLLIFFFLFAFGDLLNCLADRDLDAIYKPHLTEAVHGIGVRGVAAQAVLSAVAALALAAHLSWLLGRWVLLPGCAFGLFLAYAYSVEPFRLKGRGLWQLAFYWLGLFTGPMVYTTLLFRDWPPWDVLAVAVCFGMVQTGVILVNTAEDYPEDRAMGVNTVIVVLGLRRGLGLAQALTTLGSIGIVASYWELYRRRGVVPPGIVALLPLVVACYTASRSVWRLKREVDGAAEEAAVAAVKRAAWWVPVWITAVALASLLAAWVAFTEARHAKDVLGPSP
jgi:4-hydroxybenzoate polyprenyltransferase